MKFGRKKQNKASQKPRTSSSLSDSQKEQRVFSYYTASHKQLNKFDRRKSQLSVAPEVVSRHARTVRKHWFVAFCALIVVISALYILTLSTTPRLVVEGTNYRALSTYQEVVTKELSKNPINMFKPTLQRAGIEKQLKEEFPEAKSIKVTAPLLGRRANVAITMDEPAAVLQQPGNKDLIISSRGRLLLATSQSKTTTDLPVILNQSSVTGKQGEQFIRPGDMESFTALFGQIRADGSRASYILPVAPREFIMLEPSRGEYQVKLQFGDTILQQYGALRAAQKKLSELGTKPNEYVDARVAGKVFYK